MYRINCYDRYTGKAHQLTTRTFYSEALEAAKCLKKAYESVGIVKNDVVIWSKVDAGCCEVK
jgi:hypothetical protein